MCVEPTGRFKMNIAWFLLCLLAYLSSTSVQASKSNLVVDIEPKRQTAVRLGESLQIMCRVGRPLLVCRVEIPGEEGGMVLSKGQPAEDGIEYFGDGTETGQCGVHISKIKEKNDGIFKCTLTTTDRRAEAQASVQIIVAKPPHNPELHTNPGSYGRNIYRKGEKLEVSCSAPGGRPAANVSLFLDDEPIGNEERTTIYDSNIDDNSLAVQNASRSLDWTDNGKSLRCVSNHIALDRPKETIMQLQVYYPPQPQQPIGRFGYIIGREGMVNVTVYANPKPRFLWRVNDEKINEGHPDESNRIQTSTAVDLGPAVGFDASLSKQQRATCENQYSAYASRATESGSNASMRMAFKQARIPADWVPHETNGKGAWSVILTIDSVQKSDTEKEYVLEARNDEGASEYTILLSTSTEPTGVDLDAGSIIGIVVGVLVLLLVVFMLIFARATGRWCFAGGSTSRNLGESSDTESAGRYSRTEVDGSEQKGKPRFNLTRLFRRNKDKVSGTDTDTMRTVVTVDDEKVQTAEQQSGQDARTNPTTVEGGLVYAELDLQQQGVAPRRLNEEKTEYAEILYTKPEGEEEQAAEK